jgi:hypothetical protein
VPALRLDLWGALDVQGSASPRGTRSPLRAADRRSACHSPMLSREWTFPPRQRNTPPCSNPLAGGRCCVLALEPASGVQTVAPPCAWSPRRRLEVQGSASPRGDSVPPEGGRPTVRLSPPDVESRVDLPPATKKYAPLFESARREAFLTVGAGAGERIRTADLLITSEPLYRLSYTGFGLMSLPLRCARCDPALLTAAPRARRRSIRSRSPPPARAWQA